MAVGEHSVFGLRGTFSYILVIFRFFHFFFPGEDFILILVLFLEVDRWLDLLLFGLHFLYFLVCFI